MTINNGRRPLRRTVLIGVGALLVMLALSATRAPFAEAKVICDPVGYMYPAGKEFYAIAGIRCSKKIHKIVVSGYVYGYHPHAAFFELRKSCLNAAHCLVLTPNLKNPPGRQKWRIVYAGGFKEHIYSIPPTYKGFSKHFWF